MSTAKSIIADLGASAVAKRLGVGVTAISNAVVAGSFPSAWWFELDRMGKEKGVDVPQSLFRWRSPTKRSQADCAPQSHV